MENFTNQIIDLDNLPKMESIDFIKIHPDYWKIILINYFLLILLVTTATSIFVYFNQEKFLLFISLIFSVLALFLALLFGIYRISFLKKGYAFRNHDVVFRQGIIATNTMVIPYNRIQHIALHEGILARKFGLAAIEIFTAGGDASDITIPGIKKQQAESIKQLLMGKINIQQ